eukprot:CAMPEP_0196757396 /NCGR_PEP_ID=MMETSP1091-20130531/103636_1 /TAXON_ID=302021 /ORGANISM="Rhodomonas sp., Strain CCMP768" /LENGTH=414 /DNA_ID=CAMNT_0042106169 /DNA_START=24 /DNA_END=1265 /DNA_ORIENTATION=-
MSAPAFERESWSIPLIDKIDPFLPEPSGNSTSLDWGWPVEGIFDDMPSLPGNEDIFQRAIPCSVNSENSTWPAADHGHCGASHNQQSQDIIIPPETATEEPFAAVETASAASRDAAKVSGVHLETAMWYPETNGWPVEGIFDDMPSLPGNEDIFQRAIPCSVSSEISTWPAADHGASHNQEGQDIIIPAETATEEPFAAVETASAASRDGATVSGVHLETAMWYPETNSTSAAKRKVSEHDQSATEDSDRDSPTTRTKKQRGMFARLSPQIQQNAPPVASFIPKAEMDPPASTLVEIGNFHLETPMTWHPATKPNGKRKASEHPFHSSDDSDRDSPTSKRTKKQRGMFARLSPQIQQNARQAQRHWGEKVQEVRAEWTFRCTQQHNAHFSAQIVMCTRLHIKSQHECILRQLQM